LVGIIEKEIVSRIVTLREIQEKNKDRRYELD
jgi:hypothetical protein